MGDPASFEDRLRVARQRQGLDAPVPAASGAASGTSALGVGVRVGVELVSALVVAVGLGWLLDRWLHTLPLFLILSVILGGAAGVANVWRLLGPSGAFGGRGVAASPAGPGPTAAAQEAGRAVPAPQAGRAFGPDEDDDED